MPENIVSEYQWVHGLSVTEMEIMHGAYRIDNPNGELNPGFAVIELSWLGETGASWPHVLISAYVSVGKLR